MSGDMKKIRDAILLLCLCAPQLRAGPGTTALPFLKLDQGARPAAMGGAYTAAGDDAWTVFYNPAGAALVQRPEIALGHNEWLEGMRNESAVYTGPSGPDTTIFAGLNALFSGAMDRFDVSGTQTGSFSSQEGALSLGAATAFGGGYYGGAAVKGLYQRATVGSAYAVAGDAGLLKVDGHWRFGLSAANFGTRLKLGSTAFPLPLMLRAGIAWTYLDMITIEADGVKAGESAAAPAVGAEGEIPTGPDGAFYVRAGYTGGRSRFAGSGVTAGLGLRNGDLRVDYAFAPYGELGDAHRITIAVRFGGERKKAEKRRYAAPQRKVVKAAAVAEKAAPEKAKAAPAKKKATAPGGSGGKDVYFMW